MEDFCERYTNVAMAGPNYFMFAVRKSKDTPPFYLNTRIYSCNLIRNDYPRRWRGRYNEDTILSLDMLEDGWCTILFNAFLQYKMVTPVKQGTVVAQASVNEGRSKSVPVMAPKDVRALVKRGEEKGVSVKFNGGAVAAPVKKGQRIGTIVVTRGTETLATRPAVAAQDVPKQAWWKALLPF